MSLFTLATDKIIDVSRLKGKYDKQVIDFVIRMQNLDKEIRESKIDNSKEIMIAFDSFKVQEKNTFVKEDEMTWRNNLKVGDKVDFLTSNKIWVEGYVKETNENGEIAVKALGEIEQNIVFLKKASDFSDAL